MSALAQVYGALVFGVAVFLVLRYRELRATASSCAFEFAWFLIRVDHPLGQWWKAAGLIDVEIRLFVPRILGSGNEGIDQLANRALSKLDGKDPTASPVEELRAGVRCSAEQCKTSSLALRRFSREARSLMACPASICGLFSTALLNTDPIEYLGWLGLTAWSSVLLAAVGMIAIVREAVRVLGASRSNGEASDKPVTDCMT
jgi:hypothetical protein